MKADFDLRQEGCIRIENHGMKYMYYRPLPINNWYLLTVAPASVLDSKMNAVLGRTYLLGAFMVLIFAGILIYILKDQKRRKAELMHSLYTDEITGGYSFAKFQVEAEKKIRRAEVGSWSLISLDIDDFKFINELLGYEEGNHLISMEFWGNGAAVRRFLPISLRICLWPWQTAAITMCCAGAWRNCAAAFSRIPSGLRTSWPSCRRWESFRFVIRVLRWISVWTVPELPERAGRGSLPFTMRSMMNG